MKKPLEVVKEICKIFNGKLEDIIYEGKPAGKMCIITRDLDDFHISFHRTMWEGKVYKELSIWFKDGFKYRADLDKDVKFKIITNGVIAENPDGGSVNLKEIIMPKPKELVFASEERKNNIDIIVVTD